MRVPLPTCSPCGLHLQRLGVTAEPAVGGLLVSGRWSWASSCHQAEWGVLGVPMPQPTAAGAVPGVVLIPTSELTIEATWDMAGMRGTGSDTLVAKGVFVPYHRIRTFSDVLTDHERAGEPLYWSLRAR
ncbi:hypothetical protein [Streptomyces osmaniensis]|uniref:Uncharacterized protein n=1 Tax=Streptomyces osmaniensis TaxID=593134 RepID=A0ABP6YXW7_9ACTN|nr:hypothetical protein KJK32_44495 [Streptomyces sp. JCM17656]